MRPRWCARATPLQAKGRSLKRPLITYTWRCMCPLGYLGPLALHAHDPRTPHFIACNASAAITQRLPPWMPTAGPRPWRPQAQTPSTRAPFVAMTQTAASPAVLAAPHHSPPMPGRAAQAAGGRQCQHTHQGGVVQAAPHAGAQQGSPAAVPAAAAVQAAGLRSPSCCLVPHTSAFPCRGPLVLGYAM